MQKLTPFLLLSLLVGCDDTAQGVKRDVKEVGAATKEVAREVKEETKEVAKEAGEVAAEAGAIAANAAVNATEKAVEGVANAAQEVNATKQAVDVKTALMADTTIDSTGITVSADDNSRTIFLRGHVPNQDQKTAAERVARLKAQGFNVKNELTIK